MSEKDSLLLKLVIYTSKRPQ